MWIDFTCLYVFPARYRVSLKSEKRRRSCSNKLKMTRVEKSSPQKHRVLEAVRVKMDLLEFSSTRPLVLKANSIIPSRSTTALHRLLREKTITLLLLKGTTNRIPAGICFLGGKVWHVGSERNGSGLIKITRTATN